jgi:hypothetical protein
MPSVGGRKFPYDKKGEAAAAQFADKTGQKMTVKTGDEGLPFVPKAQRRPGMGDEGKPIRPGRPGRGDEGMKLKKKVPKKPPRRTK